MFCFLVVDEAIIERRFKVFAFGCVRYSWIPEVRRRRWAYIIVTMPYTFVVHDMHVFITHGSPDNIVVLQRDQKSNLESTDALCISKLPVYLITVWTAHVFAFSGLDELQCGCLITWFIGAKFFWELR